VIVKQVDLASQSPDLQSRSVQEATVLQVLDHPHVISYIESFMFGSILCIVMEYAVGGDLWHRITQARGHFPESQIIQWLRELCLGLQHIHSHHILHRDLKCQNIFLDDADHVKIGDFGIAKTLEHSDDFAHTIVGSPFYLSPEICMGIPYNAASDVWSLGCVLYEMCTLSPAFSGNNMGAIVLKIMQEKQPPIPSVYSRGLGDLVAAMLNKTAKWRPSLSDIVNFPLLKCDLPNLPKVKNGHRKVSGKRRLVEKRAESALRIVPLAIEQPTVVRNQVKQRQSVSSKKPKRPPAPPRLKDGAAVSKFLMVKPLNNRESVRKSKSELERVTRFDASELDRYSSARREVRNLRTYLNSTIGQDRVQNACELLRNDDSQEEQVLAELGGSGNEKFVVLVRRLIIAEEAIAE
jgi:serine/threonine protein kinase